MVEQFFLARAGARDVKGWKNALVREIAVEVNLHVASTFEFLENDVVHAAAGFDQRRGDDGQAATFLNIAGRAKKALRFLQSIRFDAAAHDFAAARLHG